jgi:hypothetical protein
MRLDGTTIGKFGRAGKLPNEFGTVNAIDCRSARYTSARLGISECRK